MRPDNDTGDERAQRHELERALLSIYVEDHSAPFVVPRWIRYDQARFTRVEDEAEARAIIATAASRAVGLDTALREWAA